MFIIITIVFIIMYTLKLTTVGSSTGVIIPKEMLKNLKLNKGDSLYAVETPDGYVLTPYNPEIGGTDSKRSSIYENSIEKLLKL